MMRGNDIPQKEKRQEEAAGMRASRITTYLTQEISDREREGRAVSRRAAAEGAVLLENDGMLPLREGARIALFGMGAGRTVKGGTGSGDVNSRDTVNVRRGLENAGYLLVNSDWLDRYEEACAAAAVRAKRPGRGRRGFCLENARRKAI